MMQETEKRQEKQRQAKDNISEQFRWRVILGHLRREVDGDVLLHFAQQTGIKMMFDGSLPEKVPALTFIRESRLPQNQERGTVILLNPQVDDGALSRALLEKLHFCCMASSVKSPCVQTPSRQQKLSFGNEFGHKK